MPFRTVVAPRDTTHRMGRMAWLFKRGLDIAVAGVTCSFAAADAALAAPPFGPATANPRFFATNALAAAVSPSAASNSVRWSWALRQRSPPPSRQRRGAGRVGRNPQAYQRPSDHCIGQGLAQDLAGRVASAHKCPAWRDEPRRPGRSSKPRSPATGRPSLPVLPCRLASPYCGKSPVALRQAIPSVSRSIWIMHRDGACAEIQHSRAHHSRRIRSARKLLNFQ